MLTLSVVFLICIGLFIGLLNSLIGLRIPVKESPFVLPLRCSTCRYPSFHRYDLLPIFGTYQSKGRCKSCGAQISSLYLVGELSTALLFAWLMITYGWSKELLIGIPLISLSVMITISDLKYMLIPNRILAIFAILFIPLRLWIHEQPLVDYLLGFFIGGGILLLVALLSRGGMGMGDVKLFFLYGWILGFPKIIVAFFVGTLLGGVVGGVLFLFKIVRRKEPIPFGPFLAMGSLVAYGYGEEIIKWYFSLLG